MPLLDQIQICKIFQSMITSIKEDKKYKLRVYWIEILKDCFIKSNPEDFERL